MAPQQPLLKLNLFMDAQGPPPSCPGVLVEFEGLRTERSAQRRSRLQGLVNQLVGRGHDAAVVHGPNSDFDIAILTARGGFNSTALDRWASLSPRWVESEEVRSSALEKAWQNRVRVHLGMEGYLRIGSDVFVRQRDIAAADTIFLPGFRVQSVLAQERPAVFVDPRHRIMEPITPDDLARAERDGDESEVRVRLLPRWSQGHLLGRTGRTAGDVKFTLGSRTVPGHVYWAQKHGLDFVAPGDEMVEVFLPRAEKAYEYPLRCVYREYRRGMSLPDTLKKGPGLRIQEALAFIKEALGDLRFAERGVTLQGPVSAAEAGYSERKFRPEREFRVEVGDGRVTSISGLRGGLTHHGPYSGPLDGEYVVIHPGMSTRHYAAFSELEKAYAQLGCGTLRPCRDVGDDGFVDAGGESGADFLSAITDLRSTLEGRRILAYVVLPQEGASSIYYKSRDALFERLFGMAPIPVQAIALGTLAKLTGSGQSYYIAVNTAGQTYVKLGGTGTALWVLREPADAGIPGLPPGSSCYAYHDVSRRPKMKASATAYSAMTDAYGRYIATGSKPVGGERLTAPVFHDILVELLRKVSLFTRRYGTLETGKQFHLKRLVFAKDGVLWPDEAAMLEDVIRNGIPAESRDPIPELLSRLDVLPDSLIIDIVGVNKSPNKRLIRASNGSYTNVGEGTAVAYDDRTGLLVGCPPFRGTSQPLEISIWRHLCLNGSETPQPHVLDVMQEYYRMSFLDWASIFRQGKYALPQILTQNLGEHLSAGVAVPEDMILL